MKIIALFQTYNCCKNKKGFTLVEALIAVSVLLVAIVGSVSLVTKGLFDFQFSKNKIVSANLAQEGVELVRIIRENNVFCDGLNGPTDHKWNESMDVDNRTVDVKNTLPMSCPGASGFTPDMPQLGGSCDQKLRIDSSGTYNYSDGLETIFSRCVHICTPPSSSSECGVNFDTGDVPLIPKEDQMDVVSIVTWEERGNTRTITIRERLYDWR